MVEDTRNARSSYGARAGACHAIPANGTLRFRFCRMQDILRPKPATIRFEITESVLMHDLEQAVALLQQLKQLGFGLSIDDFGTGYASLSYLRRFPVDEIKIDRSFVQHAPVVDDNAAIVGSVLSMARGMKLQVVAEGVETHAQLDFLAARGCDAVQGWLISHPLEPGAAAAFVMRDHTVVLPRPGQET
jgi:EAL domain-containing protein (putative c-di-GMP-specific phosphodiesterase class I)